MAFDAKAELFKHGWKEGELVALLLTILCILCTILRGLSAV